MVEGKAASTSGGSLTKRLNNEKLSPGGRDSAAQSPKQSKLTCPSCGDSRIVKDGLRQTSHGEVQRFYCKSCGYRFSLNHQRVPIPPPAGIPHSRTSKQQMPFRSCCPEKNIDIYQHVERIDTKILRLRPPIYDRRAGDEDVSSSKDPLSQRKMKHTGSLGTRVLQTTEDRNLARVETRQEKAAGATTKTNVKSKLFQYAWWMKKNNFSETTIRVYSKALQLLTAKHVNLSDPENVKDALARSNKSESWKSTIAAAYTVYLKMYGGTWQPPLYKHVRKLPFIPTEHEIDQLTAGCGKRTATFLLLLKETAMRSGEACRLKWKDVDLERRLITLNEPEKGGVPRIFNISQRLAAMLKALMRNDNRVFPNYRSIRATFYSSRKRIARKLKSPRLLRIHFHTLRHWKATMEYHKTKDLLHVKQLLGHRSVDMTTLYIQLDKALFNDKPDEFHVKVARSTEDVKALLEVGFEYVCERNGTLFFRKRK